MTDPTNLKEELDSFKSKMEEVNKSLEHFEAQFHVEQIKIYNLRSSFTDLVKLINHELIKSFDGSNQLIKKLTDK